MDDLFTSVPVEENIGSITHQIYNEKKLLQICTRTVVRMLMLKLTTECAFQLNQNLYKQESGCIIWGSLSVTLSDILIIRTERDVLITLKPSFYKRHVDDIYSWRKKNYHDELYEKLNSYHTDIKVIVEDSPNKFVDTEIIEKEDIIYTGVYRNKTSSSLGFQYSKKVQKEHY